jgi:3-hydroxyisobutyrate dehydrogenase
VTENDAATRVGWIGLGAMGFPMAGCVARAGFDVSAYDINPARAEALTTEG